MIQTLGGSTKGMKVVIEVMITKGTSEKIDLTTFSLCFFVHSVSTESSRHYADDISRNVYGGCLIL